MIAVAQGLKVTLQCLERSKIEYMVVGSIATAIYGEPRLTRDLDVVVRVTTQTAKIFLTNFPEREFYVPPEVVIVQEFSRRGQFNVLHHQSGLKVDVVVQKSTPHGIEEFTRRRLVEILPEINAWVAAALRIFHKYVYSGTYAGILAWLPFNFRKAVARLIHQQLPPITLLPVI